MVIDLIVVRARKNGELAMAKPCSGCLPILKRFGNIRHIYYSNYEGYFSRESIFDMETDHLCSSQLAKLRKT